MKKIGIFGGSFDPIHYGHLHLAEEARCIAGLDQVVFIPTYRSPYKQNTKPASCEERWEMMDMALKSNPYFHISDVEISIPRVSYTIETLRSCRKTFGEEVKLYFITGSDAFMGIEGWNCNEELLRDYSFLIGTRPGYREDTLDVLIEKLTMVHSADIQKIRIPQLDISSSDIREKIGNGESVRYLLPDELISYIQENKLYLSINDRIKEFIESSLKASRLQHTYGVAEEAVKLAKRFGGDAEKAETCALFHDAFRSKGDLAHGEYAAQFMEIEFGISDADMLNAVRYHTTGRAKMSLLEKIIYLADAIEPNRVYPGVAELRKMSELDLDRACLMSLERSIQYIKERNLSLDGNTLKAKDDLLNKRSRYEQ